MTAPRGVGPSNTAERPSPALSGAGGPEEPRLGAMIIAALVLLAAVGVMLWFASLAPFGNSVTVTIRSP